MNAIAAASDDEITNRDFGRIDEITSIHPDTRDKLIAWYLHQPEPVRVEIHNQQTDLLRTNRQAWGPASDPIVAYSCLILGIRKIARLESGLRSKGAPSPEELRMLQRVRILHVTAKKKRGGRKRAKLEGTLKPEIERLLDKEGLSYRQASKYLQRYHQINVSHTYLYNLHNEWGQND